MPRYSHGGIDVWFGTDDAPAPQDVEARAEPSITVGISGSREDAVVHVRHRRTGGTWQRMSLLAVRTTNGLRYFAGKFPLQPAGTRVEYEVYVRNGGKQRQPERRIGETNVFTVVHEATSAAPRGKTASASAAGAQPAASVSGTTLKATQLAGLSEKVASLIAEKAPDLPLLDSDATRELIADGTLAEADAGKGSQQGTMVSEQSLATVIPVLPASPSDEPSGTDQTDKSVYPAPECHSEVLHNGSAEPQPPLRAWGKLTWKDKDRTDSFAGFRVLASVTTRIQLGGAIQPIAEERSVTLQSGSEFGVMVPQPQEGTGVSFVVRYPNGGEAASARCSVEEAQHGVILEIPALAPPVLTMTGVAAAPHKLKGKVIDSSGARKIANAQVIIWVAYTASAGAAETSAAPIFIAVTDANGNFSGEQPKGMFKAAFATVANTANARPDAGVPINVTEDKLLPDFVYIVVETNPTNGADEACVCNNQTPRQPDQDDLISNSTTYSQDIGGACINFTTPNRTLEEFTYCMAIRTTEPEIKGTTLSDQDRRSLTHYALSLDLDLQRQAGKPVGADLRILAHYLPKARGKSLLANQVALEAAVMASTGAAQKSVAGRGELNVDNSVDWDSTPTFYQATTIAHGHLVYFKQMWKADGYSMGDLLYSLPLAPGQKKNIVIFDWDRSEAARREEDAHEDEALNSYLTHDRDVNDIVHTTLTEHTDGYSQSNTFGQAGGVGGAGGVGAPPVFVGVAGGWAESSGNASTTAWQNSSRDACGSALNQLRDSIQQSASAVRNQRATVVQTASQAERFRVETEVVANYNHCHAITIQYFEILRHFAIHQEVSHVQECLFIPLLMREFDEAMAVRWADLLKPRLRAPATASISLRVGGGLAARRSSLAEGFAAIERRQADYAGSNLPDGRYADEMLEDLNGELTITISLNRPKDKDDGGIDPAAWETFISLSTFNANTIFTRWLKDREAEERDRAFDEEIAPKIVEGFVDRLKFGAVDSQGRFRVLSIDATLITRYRRDRPLYITIRATARAFDVRRSDIERIVIFSDFDLSASADSRIIVRSGKMSYRTLHFSSTLFSNSSINNDLKNATLSFANVVIPTDNVAIYTPLTSEEMRNPREEDEEKARLLLKHLNANIEYYHRVIWLAMDPSRRFMLLDGFIAPFSGGRSVASVVENRVIGIAGNCIIMPVAPGYKLDPSYQLQELLDEYGEPMVDEAGQRIAKSPNLLDLYRPLTPFPPYRISLPTRGVFAEAVQGVCNSCEKEDNTRYWRWEEHPIPDQPTQIMPVNTNPPQRSDVGNLNPTPFPTPMINIQNAPVAPEPGAGLAGAFDLLGKSNLFRDVTGIEGTQQNALQAMLSNQEFAKHFTDKATELAVQASAIKHGASTVDQIKAAMADGTIDKATGSKLIERQLAAQIDGGKAAANDVTAANSKLAAVSADAVAAGKPVQAAQTFPDGTSATVKQEASPVPAGDKIDFTVSGKLTPLKQPSSKTCWAAAAAIMSAWKKSSKTAPTVSGEIALLGHPFVGFLEQDMPLAATDKNALLAKLGLVPDPLGLMSAGPEAYLDLMKDYGPLWATVDGDPSAAASQHAKILYGMRGDGTAQGTKLRVIDPRNGTSSEQSFTDFHHEFEELARSVPAGKPLTPQIVRFADKLEGEGSSTRTVFDDLTDIARRASMGLSARRDLKLKPIPTEASPFTVFNNHGRSWNGLTKTSPTDATETSDVQYPITHGNHEMQMTVVDRMAWDSLEVTFSGRSHKLQLTSPFLIAYDSSDVEIEMKEASPIFPLEGNIETRTTLLYGYIVDTVNNSVKPIDLGAISSENVEQWLLSGGAPDGAVTTKRVVLALYDLTFMAEAGDFQPKLGAPWGPASTARFYPLLSVWCNAPADQSSAELWLQRPESQECMADDMEPGNKIRTSFYTDNNDNMKPAWDDLSLGAQSLLLTAGAAATLMVLAPHPFAKLIGAGGDAFVAAIVASLHLIPTVRWESIFAHYKLDVNLDPTKVVDRTKSMRTNAGDREVMDSASADYVPKLTTKVAGQGAFDNVHIAPNMVYDGAKASMAPVCQHDCLHMHWRWSRKFTDSYLYGWKNGVPYAEPGVPMIPENQDLTIASSGSLIRYRPLAKNVPAANWQIFCHHGLAYATDLTVVGYVLPLLESASRDTPLALPAYNALYYHNRFWETGGENRAADKPRINEAKFGPLETM